MKKISALLILANLLLFCSCTKKKETTTNYIPDNLKTYSIFQKGSYWQYKNEITGILDSTVIAKGPLLTYHQDEPYDYSPIVEECEIFYGGTFLKTAYVNPSFYQLGIDAYAFEAIQSYSFSPGQIVILEPQTTLTYVSLKDSLKIYNHTFTDVLITKWQRITSQSDTFSCTSYFVKKIGLVKYIRQVNAADTTWNLINYHVIQ
jgi:hypothetical protein